MPIGAWPKETISQEVEPKVHALNPKQRNPLRLSHENPLVCCQPIWTKITFIMERQNNIKALQSLLSLPLRDIPTFDGDPPSEHLSMEWKERRIALISPCSVIEKSKDTRIATWMATSGVGGCQGPLVLKQQRT